jgi:urease accessory protein
LAKHRIVFSGAFPGICENMQQAGEVPPVAACPAPTSGVNLASSGGIANDPATMTLPQPILAAEPSGGTPSLERVRGVARVIIGAGRNVVRLRKNHQEGSAKVRFPRTAAGRPMEAILLNTAGGLTGGDRLTYSITVEAAARGVATTQAAERIYRSAGGTARIDTHLAVNADAELDWLPQETILFDRSALARTLAADVHPTARLLAVEAIILGRAAMGERAPGVSLSDSWRIRRNGALVFADGLQLDGNAACAMAGGATGNGAAALATLVLLAPEAEAKLDMARQVLAGARGEGGASAWNGMLVARLIAPNGQVLRADLMRLVEALRGKPMPRVWTC